MKKKNTTWNFHKNSKKLKNFSLQKLCLPQTVTNRIQMKMKEKKKVICGEEWHSILKEKEKTWRVSVRSAPQNSQITTQPCSIRNGVGDLASFFRRFSLSYNLGLAPAAFTYNISSVKVLTISFPPWQDLSSRHISILVSSCTKKMGQKGREFK